MLMIESEKGRWYHLQDKSMPQFPNLPTMQEERTDGEGIRQPRAGRLVTTEKVHEI